MLDAELEAARKEARRPDGKTLVRAFIEPVISFFRSERGGQSFMKIISRMHADPDDTIRRLFLAHMIPVFKRFLSAFHQAMPQMPPERIAPRLLFSIGAVGHGADLLVDEDLRKKSPKLGLPPILESDAFVEELLDYVCRGMEVT